VTSQVASAAASAVGALPHAANMCNICAICHNLSFTWTLNDAVHAPVLPRFEIGSSVSQDLYVVCMYVCMYVDLYRATLTA